MKKIKLPSLHSLVPQAKTRKPMNKLQAHASRLTQSAYDDYEEPTTKLSTAFVVVLVLHLVAVGGIYAFHSIKAKRREADGTAVSAKVQSPSVAPGAGAAAQPLKPAPVVQPVTQPVTQPVVVKVPAPASIPAAMPAPKTASATARVEITPPQQSHLAPPSGPSAVIPAQKTPAPVSTAAAPGTVAAKAQPPSVVPIKAVAAVPAVVPVAGTAADSAPKTYTVLKGDNPVAIAKRMGVNYEEMLKLNGIEDARKLQIGQVLKMPAKKQAN